MIDIVTVVFDQELEILRRQARSIELYTCGVGSIYVIVNHDHDLENVIDPTWWGKYQDKVKITPRTKFGSDWSANGWLTQQALKLMAAAQSDSQWSVILDAKTIFVEPFFDVTLRPEVGQLDIYPVFESSRKIANQLFGIDLQKQLGPGGVPFVINTAMVSEMIFWIQQHTQQDFATWFQAQGMLTEFILYSAWIQYRTGSLNQIYGVDTNKIRPCNLCHTEIAMFEQKFSNMQSASTVSIHRNAWKQLDHGQQQRYWDFLASRGIA